jgi:ubiquinone/menaquinone biosynthesis C-methylase UbiE
MNRTHMELLASDEWRTTLRDLTFPFAFRGAELADLGDDVLEVGPGPGLTTDLLSATLPALTSLELDPALAGELAQRVDAARVTVIEGDATAMPFEDGRFSGAACFTMLHHVSTASAQDQVLAEVCRVLRPGGLLVACDSMASDDLEAFHEDDVYNPIDPGTLAGRLTSAGLTAVTVRSNPYAWAAHARCPG